MKSDRAWKHFAYAFALAGLLYLVLFWAIERTRSASGAWIIQFGGTADGVAEIRIEQSSLGIEDVRIRFPQETAATNPPTRIVFDKARPFPHPVPYGSCVFADLTFLPGTLALDLFGQRVELLPSRLIIGSSSHPWQSRTNLAVETRLITAQPLGQKRNRIR